MFINEKEEDRMIRKVHGLSDLECALVRAYLQGCVYTWCKNRSHYKEDDTLECEPFKAQYFLGGDNYHWEGTPLFCLYAKRLRYYDGDSESACTQAARDVGHLLKYVIRKDKRTFHTWTDTGGFRWYQWDGRNDEELLAHSPEYHDYITKAKQQFEAEVDSFITTNE